MFMVGSVVENTKEEPWKVVGFSVKPAGRILPMSVSDKTKTT
jgi:hypothetical protein